MPAVLTLRGEVFVVRRDFLAVGDRSGELDLSLGENDEVFLEVPKVLLVERGCVTKRPSLLMRKDGFCWILILLWF